MGVPHWGDSAQALSNVPANVHKQAPSVTVLRTFSSSPCLRPSCEVAALFWDANIHTLLEPQIKGGVPPPASQWSLCADGSRPVESEPRDRGRGWGGGAQHKDTCHPEKSTDRDVKRGARWRMFPQPLWEDANGGENTHPCGFRGEGPRWPVPEQQSPSVPLPRLGVEADWSEGVGSDLLGTESEETKMMWEGPGGGQERPWGTVSPLVRWVPALSFLPTASISKAPTVRQARCGEAGTDLTDSGPGPHTWRARCRAVTALRDSWRLPGRSVRAGRPKRFTHIVSFISGAGLNKEVL